MRGPLDRVLDPRSIAVIGASADPAKRGYQAIRALRAAGYPYPVYPVNPRGGEVLGRTMVRGVAELPAGVDVALVATPARSVPGVVAKCAAAGIAGAVVLANGFRESGPDGAALEEELRAVIAATGIRVVGPNTSGILNVSGGVNLVGLPDVPAGPISVLAQSGNMLLSLVADNRATDGPGFDICVGLGNQAGVRYHECLDYLADRAGTGAIAVHCEGLPDGRAFLAAAARASQRRPIVVLRGGRSSAGQRAALSHTGSVAGSDEVAAAVLAQAGVELVERSDELAVVTGVLATTRPVPAGTEVVVLSDGGGHAGLAADALSAAGVPLAGLGADTRDRLRKLLGPDAAVANPIDVAGATDTEPALFAACVEELMGDPAVGLVLVVGLFGGYHLRFDARLREQEDRTAAELLGLSQRHGVPLLVQSCYATDRPDNHAILRSGGVRVLASIDHAVRAVAALYRRGQRLATAADRAPLELPDTVRPAGERALPEPAARALLTDAGLEVGPWRLVDSAEDAVRAVAGLGRACALKVVSPQVLHKSEAGGVRLGVTEDTAAAEYTALLAAVRTAVPHAEITGVIVTPMAQRGVELLVGATQDAIFGPVVAFGAGGTLVEVVRDVTFLAAPFTAFQAREMIADTAVSRLLDGYRGGPVVDRDRLAEFLVRVGEFAANTPGVRELDLNPVIATDTAILPVDVRVIVAGTNENTDV